MDGHQLLLDFIKSHGDKRVTKEAFAYYKEATNPAFASFAVFGKAGLIGVSLSGLVDNEVNYSITVVHKEFRNKGIGTKLLKEKIEKIEAHGYSYGTIVAEDNAPSLRMCDKAGMQKSGQIQRVRKSGKFLAVLLSK